MADRIATTGLLVSPDVFGMTRDDQRAFLALRDEIALAIAASTVVIADNVIDYYASNAKTVNTGNLQSDCPCLAPSCDVLFVEHKVNPLWDHPTDDDCVPLNRLGVLYLWEKAENAVQLCHRLRFQDGMASKELPESKNAKWFCVVNVVQEFKTRDAVQEVHLPTVLSMWLDAHGVITEFNVCGAIPIDGSAEDMKLDLMGTIYGSLLAVAFMNCKNVARNDVTATEGPSDKWIRRQKTSRIRYHVLDINPMKEVLQVEGGIETNGLKKALHICRGHFATYTPDKPLFGSVVGTFWKPSHVRGTIESGAVLKDYRIGALPKTQ